MTKEKFYVLKLTWISVEIDKYGRNDKTHEHKSYGHVNSKFCFYVMSISGGQQNEYN